MLQRRTHANAIDMVKSATYFGLKALQLVGMVKEVEQDGGA